MIEHRSPNKYYPLEGTKNPPSSHLHPINAAPVFETAVEENTYTALSLSLVSDTGYAWIVPVLYKTVKERAPKMISAFHAAIYMPNSRTYERKYKLALHVRQIWIGTTDIPKPYGEHHESPEVDLMVQIFQTCTGLRAIALFAVGSAACNWIESLTYDYSGDQSDMDIADVREEFAEFLADERVRIVAPSRYTMEANWKRALYEYWRRDECAGRSDGRESTD
jgi:hypothetical protein